MNLTGVFPPIPTPFAADATLDERQLRANVARWMTTGLAGIVVLGSNGEAVLLDDDEADRTIAAAREAVPRDRTLIAGTGRESTRATIAATSRAGRAGADAVLVRTPSFYKARMTSEAMVQHYTAVADASPVPVLLYNVTMFTGVNLLPEAVAQLAAHPNIVGVKESGGDLSQISELVNLVPSGFAVLVGSGPTFYPALCVGAAGGIVGAASIVPELAVALFDAARAGRHERALDLQRRLTPIARLVTTKHGIAGLKAAAATVGYPSGDPRAPLLPAGRAAVDDIARELEVLERSSARSSRRAII